jgi:hypothetical protein
MPWSGGNFTRANGNNGWTVDATNGIGIEPGLHDAQDNDFKNGIDQCLNKDGSNAATGNLNLGGKKLTNVASAVASSDAITLGQAQAGISTQGTALSINNTRYSNDAAGPVISLLKSRGAAVPTNTIVQNGDQLGVIAFNGANGTSFTNAAAIVASVDDTPGAVNDMPGALRFYTTPNASGTLAERVIIKSSGNVGIGTSVPAHMLDVTGALRLGADNVNSSTKVGRVYGQQYLTANTDFLAIDVRGESGANIIAVGGGSGVYNSATAISFITGANVTTLTGTERMRIDASGNVNIGTTASSARLVVQAASTGTAFAAVTSGAVNILSLRDDGLITTGNATNAPYNFTTASAANLVIDASYRLARSTSSVRYKTDIQDYTRGLDAVKALRPVFYKGINDGDKQFAGLIAEEVDEAGLSEFVVYNQDGEPDALQYSNMIALAFKAIQELEARVAELEGA